MSEVIMRLPLPEYYKLFMRVDNYRDVPEVNRIMKDRIQDEIQEAKTILKKTEGDFDHVCAFLDEVDDELKMWQPNLEDISVISR